MFGQGKPGSYSTRSLVGATVLVLSGVAALVTSSCSLGKFDQVACESNAQCREAFGFGSVCGGDGLCAAAASNPRCTLAYPDDLLTSPEKYKALTVFGSLQDRSVEKKVRRERSVRLAIKQANDEGGLDGQSFGVVFCTIEENADLDDLGSADAAVASAAYLTGTLGVPAIIGPSGSGNTTAVFESLRGTETLVISQSATSPALSALDPPGPTDGNPGLLWRTAPPDSVQGQTIAADMIARGQNHVAVISQSGSYGEGLGSVVAASYDGAGRQREAFSFEEGNDNQLNEAITRVGATAATEVLFVSSSSDDVVAFLNAAAQNAQYDNKQIFLTDGAASQEIVDQVTDSDIFARVRGTRPRPLDESDFVYQTFITSFSTEYGEDITQYSFTAQSFDAAWLVLYGSAWAKYQEGGVITGPSIARGLRQVSSGESKDIVASSWPGIVNSFRSSNPVNVNGASGSLDYNPDTEEITTPSQIWLIMDDGKGGFEIVPEGT